ncbi:MAG TPA: Rieske 2Fe-2S domain-containing protein [Polyangiales bacterium]|nr:Rieske 2Fe-2S domain-containing protein [Polyangiales bacterium]
MAPVQEDSLGESFRFPGIPVGWYTVATSREVKAGRVLAVKYFGQELVLYRTESGEARLTDAYCPHMGAYLGTASVQGENLRCPFHGFEFGGDGRCVRAYGKSVPRKAKLETWAVREHNGFIFAWYHPERTEPEWEIPVLPGPGEGWTSFRTRRRELASHPQETSENSVDVGHFLHLHNFTDAWYEGDLDIQGHLLKGAYGLKYRLPGVDPLTALFNVEVHGLGYSLVRIRVPRFDAEINLLVLSSPVDADNIVFRTSVAMKKWGPSALTHLIRELASLGVAREISQDAPIWEAKRYVEKPVLAEGDGPIAEYRRYCKQFYPEQAVRTAKLPVVAA